MDKPFPVEQPAGDPAACDARLMDDLPVKRPWHAPRLGKPQRIAGVTSMGGAVMGDTATSS